MDATSQISANEKLFNQMGSELERMEKQVSATIINELKTQNPGRKRAECDKILGDYYGHAYLIPCIANGIASRVAYFGSSALIPIILELEKKMNTEFHKGALFYNTAIAYLLSGNEDGCEYFLAMTDEEEVKNIEGAKHERGTMNLRSGELVGQTIVNRMEFFCKILDGTIIGGPLTYSLLTGRGAVSGSQLDAWRQNYDALHQFELLRVIHDMQSFLEYYSDYQPVIDNPFVMLRMGKALAHLAQWVESCLTAWQGSAGPGGALGGKLKSDPDFGTTLSKAAGNPEKFAGYSPHGSAVDTELRQLMSDIAAARIGPEQQWRLLRILYIVRNSTAHIIEPNLKIYTDRKFLLEVMQAVFVSIFVICQLKGKQMPN